MEQYIDKNKDVFINIARDHNIDKDMLLNAFKIVREFIINRQLILFGGLAIDYALRLKGSYIYSVNELPDYDCLSSRSVDDAYDLAEILHNTGFENVKVIRAKHISTMRVRINLITVIDIGYCPDIYYKKYKTLLYDGIKIVHPDIQKLDLHKAFCFPLNNAPMEDIFHRWKKDLYRFNLLDKYYPIIKPKKLKINLSYKEFILPFHFNDKRYAFHGFAAYALLYKKLSESVNIKHLPKIDILFTSINTCSLELPIEDDKIAFVTSKENIWKDSILYSNILEIIPEHCKDTIIIYFIDMLSITNIDQLQIVNIQYILLYFLFYYNFGDDKYKDIYQLFYYSTLQMVEIADTLVYPSLQYLGNEPKYIPQTNNDQLPINYNPYKIGTRKTFDYSIFKVSGEVI